MIDFLVKLTMDSFRKDDFLKDLSLMIVGNSDDSRLNITFIKQNITVREQIAFMHLFLKSSEYTHFTISNILEYTHLKTTKKEFKRMSSLKY